MYLMRLYLQNNLTPEKSAFNYRLLRARRCVECTFGILCAKWCILAIFIEPYLVRACVIIKAALCYIILKVLEATKVLLKWLNVPKLILQIILNATQLTLTDEILIVSVYKI
jgi:hypothetical protein